MRGLINGFKRFLSNKNTVTVIGVFAIIAIIYFGYNWRVNQAITPRLMPVAGETIQPRTKITVDMVDYVNVPPALLTDGVIANSKNIVGQYANYNTVIPEGSLFFDGTLITYAELPDVALIDIPEGEVAYNFEVDIESSYGNSIMPDSYIDIYFKAVDEAELLIVGKLVENVKVLVVKDKSGRHVFENSEENRIPATFIFSVSKDVYILLKKAEYMNDYDAELIPVPTSETYSLSPGSLEITSTWIENFINDRSISQEQIEGEIIIPDSETEETGE